MTYEGIRLKIRNKVYLPLTANYRKKLLKITDFTIISNNCWGGTIYESYNLMKQSPTVGLFFVAEDYIKFVSQLEYYLNLELKFISPEQTKWRDIVSKDSRFGKYPIGLLGDIEIHFLHYADEKSAYEKWCRRCERINWNKLIIKFNDQNGCEEKHIAMFDKLQYKNKICFCVKDYPQYESVVKIKSRGSKKYVMASYEPIGNNRYFNVTDYINSI